MRVAVVGAGGVGGYFGARLWAAGEDVTFIARGAHLRAIRTAGLRVDSPLGDVLVHPARATDDPAQVGPVDVALFAVKLWDTEQAARAVRPLLGRDTAVVSIQNGVEAAGVLGSVLGRAHVMGGTCFIFSVISEPGRVTHAGPSHRLVFGELDGRESERGRAFLTACRGAGIDAHLSTMIARDIWEKFVYLTALSGLTALTRRPIGPVLGDPELKAMFQQAIAEAVAVGRASGAPLGGSVVDERMAVAEGLPADARSSMLNDLERGTRLELPWLSGAVVRMGREFGIETPVHAFIAAALKLHAGGRDA